MPLELPNSLRLRIGNWEISGNSRNWLETEASTQSSFQKWNFSHSGQKLRKRRYQSFLVLPDCAYFFLLRSRYFFRDYSFDLKFGHYGDFCFRLLSIPFSHHYLHTLTNTHTSIHTHTHSHMPKYTQISLGLENLSIMPKGFNH